MTLTIRHGMAHLLVSTYHMLSLHCILPKNPASGSDHSIPPVNIVYTYTQYVRFSTEQQTTDNLSTSTNIHNSDLQVASIIVY